MMDNWQQPETTPKDGTVFIGVFASLPQSMSVCWNPISSKWAAATHLCGPVNGVWADFYFETEYFVDAELLKWQPMPEVGE